MNHKSWHKQYESAAKIVRRLAEPYNAGILENQLVRYKLEVARQASKEIRRRKEDAKVASIAFILLFREEDPNFDEERFMTACGVSEFAA